MIVSTAKLGGIAPDEKDMINEKASTLIDLTKDYSKLVDSSLKRINLTDANLAESVFT